MDSVVPADILGVQVTQRGLQTRIVTVTGELDALTAPALATVLTETLATAQVVVDNYVLINRSSTSIHQLGDVHLVARFPLN